MEPTTENTDFQVKFDGQMHQVDVNLMVASLLNFTTILQETNAHISPEKKVDIRIKAPEKGSFLLTLSLVLSEPSNLLTGLAASADVVGVSIGLFQLRKHLRGEEPKNVEVYEENGEEYVKIENTNGDVYVDKSVTYNIYNNNQPVQDAITNTFSEVKNDANIDGFEISSAETEKFTVEKDDFDYLSEKHEVSEENTRTITDEEAELHVFKLVFKPGYKWEFYYKGNKIIVEVKDADFYKKIDEGASFAKGDTLFGQMDIKQKFDPTINTYVNAGYVLKKVTGHTPRAKTQEIDFT